MVGWQVLSRPSAAEGGGRRPAFTGLAAQPYSATEVDGWQPTLSRVSQNRAAVQHVRILVRADSGFAREELMAWCETNVVDFLFGLMTIYIRGTRVV